MFLLSLMFKNSEKQKTRISAFTHWMCLIHCFNFQLKSMWCWVTLHPSQIHWFSFLSPLGHSNIQNLDIKPFCFYFKSYHFWANCNILMIFTQVAVWAPAHPSHNLPLLSLQAPPPPSPQGCTNRCSLAAGLRGNGERMRKWGGNGEKMRKWREIDSLHFLILSLFPPSFSISSLSFHFLHQNASHFVAKC